MKKNQLLSLCSFALLMPVMLQSQQTSTVCDAPTAYTTIHANNIKAGLLNGGDLFWDFSDAQFIPNPTPTGPNPSTIFAAGLWMGGVDPGGNLKLATATYRASGTIDYWAGPLDDSGITDVMTCSNWDRFFRVKGADIKSYLDDLPNLVNDPSAAIAAYKDIMGWPGRGNPYFSDVWGFDLPFSTQGLAPYFDANSDGIYNPLDGDYPAVQLQGKPLFVPAEIVWCVFNDHGGGATHSASQGLSLQIEVQLTVWAFNCSDQPVLNNTLFTSHKIINRASEPLDSCFIGLWVDFDLGCGLDDYIGSAPGLDAFYVYNSDVVDGGGNCLVNFDDVPPVQSVTLLNRSMDKFIYYNNAGVGMPLPGTTDPDLPLEYYRYLTGSWRDGSPLTLGGLGYQFSPVPANYAFPDPPDDINGWSMCTENLPAGDQRSLASCKIYQLLPGQITELTAAWTFHPNPDLPCGLGQTYDDIAYLHTEYENNFSNACSPLTGISEILQAEIEVFPNPAAENVTLVYGDLPVREIRLFAADGRLVSILKPLSPERTALDVSGLSNGIYTLQMLTERGVVVKKISVLK